ncbi:MAG: c-type cytochrome [Betaproteobacteria bacterium]|nr:c-type cytochrome [Betaproteobacteria bacterium]
MSLASAARRLVACLLAWGSCEATAQSKPGDCPQARLTQSAPPEDLMKRNPLLGNSAAASAGRARFQGNADTDGCSLCHGKKGDGKGKLAKLYDPPPRNFTCAATMNAIPDGQLFWAIRHGITASGMPPHRDLTDTEVWQLVLAVRELATSR